MSADICSDVGQNLKNEANESSTNLEKVHLSSSNENNCDSNKIGKRYLIVCYISKICSTQNDKLVLD